MANLIGQKIEAIVYVEGHKIPHTNINISVFDGQPSQCSVATTAIDFVKRIIPMSMVAIFYFDNNFRKWSLLWEGIYTGWSFSRSGGHRSISLQCIDWTGLFQKVNALMLGVEDKALTFAELQIYGMGISDFVPFGKTLLKKEAVERIESKVGFIQPRGFMNYQSIISEIITSTPEISFGTITDKLIQAMLWMNPLIFYRYVKSGMKQKMTAIEDDRLKDLFKSQIITDLLLGIGTEFSGHITFDQVLQKWQNIALYGRVSVCAPPFVREDTVTLTDDAPERTVTKNAIYQTIFKPQAYFTIPPAFNTLFPEMIDTITYARNFTKETTRITLKTRQIFSEGFEDAISFFFSEKGEVKSSQQVLQEMQGLSQHLFMANFSPEEYDQYVEPSIDTIGESLFMSLGRVAQKTKESQSLRGTLLRLMGAIAHYTYLVKKYQPRPITISGPFNPYFVVGYPCTIFDPAGSFTAYPISMTHNINSSGNATTQIISRFSVELDSNDISEINRTKFPPVPAWVPSAYDPDKINNEVYNKLFGANGLGHSALGGFGIDKENDAKLGIVSDVNFNPPSEINNVGISGVGTKRINLAALANTVYSLNRTQDSSEKTSLYDLANDKVKFSRDYVRRNVTSLEQYMEFYNMEPTSNPPEIMPKAECFKHISDIRESKDTQDQGALVFVDEGLIKDKDPADPEYIDALSEKKENGEVSSTTKVTVGFKKYDQMTEIKKALDKKAFRG